MLFRDPIKICSSSTHATQLGVCTTLVGLPQPAVIRKLSSLGCPPSLHHGPTVFSAASPRCFLLTSLQLAFSPSQSYSFQIGIGGVAIPENYQDFSISSLFLQTTSREGKYEIRKHVAPHQNSLFLSWTTSFQDSWPKVEPLSLLLLVDFLKMPLLGLYFGRIFSMNIEFWVFPVPSPSALKMFHCLLVSIVSNKNSAVIQMALPLCDATFFSLVAFKNFSLF